MRMVELIEKKKQGYALTQEEIRYFIEGYTRDTIPDYQVSAFLMAICFQGMTDEETTALTLCMANSGETADLSGIPGLKADKHSTGGVGDKTTLIVAPLCAACGAVIAKMSGRGLGHTGGTIDKLESIPGFETALSPEDFVRTVRRTGLCVVGQTGNLAPADKKLYALRDVTATVQSLPLIASSIMSKKLAAGSDAIVLDVKCGSGAFMKDKEQAVCLARQMVRIGTMAGKKISAIVTNMDQPLGLAVGNALEVREAFDVLAGSGPEDLTALSIELAAQLLQLSDKGDLQSCRGLAQGALEDGSALEKCREWITAQGGDSKAVDDGRLLKGIGGATAMPVYAKTSGLVEQIDTQQIGLCACLLGAGRSKKEDVIDPGAGLVLAKKTGDRVNAGEVLATLYASDPSLFDPARALLEQSVHIGDHAPEAAPLILARIGP